MKEKFKIGEYVVNRICHKKFLIIRLDGELMGGKLGMNQW